MGEVHIGGVLAGRPSGWWGMRGRLPAVSLAAALLLGTGACTGVDDASRGPTSSPAPTSVPANAPSRATSGAPSSAVPTTGAPTSTAPSTGAPTPSSLPEPSFHARVSTIDAERAATMGTSWHPGCPVELSGLRVLEMSYWGFDDRPHRGELIVAASEGEPVVSVFRRLFQARFPVHLMEPVDAFEGDDNRSMAADNTSGFNCRAATGDPNAWSQHAYGLAVDLNPFENPYVSSSGQVTPPEARRFADRATTRKGMIQPGSVAVRAFASIGWEWGGAWTGTRDYQHFSENGH